MPDASKAVFLSYASQDAEAVQRIADALRAAGVEVWFDRNELVGGDAWDRKIRQQIRECALFVPVISAATQARGEGYFRLEWKLAVDRSHLMAPDQPFLLPVVIDDTPDAAARVADEFRAVQWTRLRPLGYGGRARPAEEDPALAKFCARVKRLLSGEGRDASPRRPSSDSTERLGRLGETSLPEKRSRTWLVPAAVIAAAVVITVGLWRPWRGPENPGASPSNTSTAVPAKPLTEAQQLVAKARTILDEGDEMNREAYALAEELLKKAESLDATEASAWALHATLSTKRYGMGLDRTATRLEALRVQAERAVRLAPEAKESQFASIKAQYVFNQDLAGVEAKLRALAAQYPGDVHILRELSRTYMRQGKTDEALTTQRHVLQLAPDNPALKAEIMNTLVLSGRWVEAQETMTWALQGRVDARLLSYDAYLRLNWSGDLAGAMSAIRAWPSWFLLEDRGAGHAAIVAWWKGDSARALEILTQFPRDYLRDYLYSGPRAVLTALVHEQADHVESAQADWRLALQVADRELGNAPDDLLALHWKAWALARLGEKAAAAGIFRRLAEQDVNLFGLPQIAGGLCGLALAIGQPDDAIAMLKRVRPDARTLVRQITKTNLRLNPIFKPLRTDPRFQALIAAAPGPEEEKAPKPASVTSAPVNEKSVAVLPFASFSADKENEFLSDAIHDDVITHLQKIRDLKVISRTSMLAYREPAGRNLAKIAAELGVATIVEGSVRRAGQSVQVNVKLIHARTETSLWAGTLLGEAGDVFGLQAQMAQRIAGELKATLTEGERTLIERRPTKNPVAYELFLKARRQDELLNNRSNRQEHEAVIAAYQRVLAEDAEFALVYCRLARVHGHMYWLGHLDPTPARRVLTQAALREAVRIDPNAPETDYARGLVSYYCDMNYAGALAHYRRAEERLPNDAVLQGQIGFTHRRLGNQPECRRHFERALELEPRYLYVGAELSASLLEWRHFEAARQLTERFATLFPEDGLIAHLRLRAEFALNGDRAAFLAALARLPRASQDPTGLRAAYERAMWAHDFAAAERILADPALGTVIDSVSIIESPAALHQALVAFLQGKKEEAKNFAAAAMAEYARGSWAPRQEPFVALDVAAAKAYAGRAEDARGEARAALAAIEKVDAHAGAFARLLAGRLMAALGEKDEALALLRRLMSGESRSTPHEIRIDPCWSRLKDDPRFEEILRSATPL